MIPDMTDAAKVCLLGALTISVAAADSLTVVNAKLANVAVECGAHAYQSYMGGTCSGPGNPQQNFNGELGIGWTLASIPGDATGPGTTGGDGILGPDYVFDTPPFTGLPFGRAIFLQGADTEAGQTITGFVPGGAYTLEFYLGSRYANGSFDGNQTVEAIVDNRVIGTWALTSYTPFTLQTVPFAVTTGGSHIIRFAGTVTGDHTAFLSGVGIATTGGLAVNPSTGEPGIGLMAAAGGFAPLEAVDLVAYASTPVVIGAANADVNGNVSLTGHLPQTPFGACGLQAVGQSSGTVVSGIISLRPRASVNPSAGEIGSTVTLTGFGFAAGETVSLEWSTPDTSLGTATANKNGTISAQFAIPSGSTAGTDQVAARGQKTGASASAQITVQ